MHVYELAKKIHVQGATFSRLIFVFLGFAYLPRLRLLYGRHFLRSFDFGAESIHVAAILVAWRKEFCKVQ